MYEALEFAGYDVKFEMGTEAHNLKQGGADLPDALRWLWRGYPEPIVVHEPAAAHEPGYDTTNRVFSTIYLDKAWEQIGGEYSPITSLTSDAAGNVYFPDGGAIDRIGPDGKVLALFSEPPERLCHRAHGAKWPPVHVAAVNGRHCLLKHRDRNCDGSEDSLRAIFRL